LPELKPRWLVTCSCGRALECSSAWAARSVSKLHQKIASADTKHAIRIEAPEPPPGSQLPLLPH
jgi:hypothetical protein